MKKHAFFLSGAFVVISSAAALFATEAKDPFRAAGYTLKAGNCADSVADTLTGEKNLYSDYAAKNADGTVNAVIEIPAGTNEKWETDAGSGRLFWECKSGAKRVVQFLGYPANYGMIPRTLGGDGDPLDVIVLGKMMRRGAVAGVKPVGVFRLVDNGEVDDKILAVVPGSFMGNLNSLTDLNDQYPGLLSIIETWFTHYKGVNGGLASQGFGDVDTAMMIINAALRDTSSSGAPVSYNESADDSLTIDGYARTYGKYGVSLTGVLGDCDSMFNDKNMYHDYSAKNGDGSVNAFIEIPAGTNSKWETDHFNGKLFWENKSGSRRIVKYLGYPLSYGMIPRTEYFDGDPLDIVVIGATLLRGSVTPVKIIGVVDLMDQGIVDDKIVAVLPGAPLSECNSVAEVDAKYPGISSILGTWFSNYKGIGGGVSSQGFNNVNPWTMLDTAMAIYNEHYHPGEGALPFVTGPKRPAIRLRQSCVVNFEACVFLSLFQTAQVQVSVYSLSGKEAAILIDRQFAAGEHRISWDARRVRPGCYILKMRAGEQTQLTHFYIVK